MLNNSIHLRESLNRRNKEIDGIEEKKGFLFQINIKGKQTKEVKQNREELY